MSKEMKVLFLTKRRGSYGYLSSGLFNSVRFIVDMLNSMGIEAKMVDCVDANSIDKEVHDYRPTHVIIEAFWCVPSKFEVLKKLHPRVKWVVRDHSDFPFMETEGMAIEWMFEYLKYGVTVAANKYETAKELGRVLGKPVAYLPNYYPVTRRTTSMPSNGGEIHIGCFGAIRPLKNQLLQAIAAIRFAETHGKRLKFYINTGRVEACGDRILKNIRALFRNTKHELIELPWLKHHQFIHLLESYIDMSMQVSFSETFNLVTGDAVNLDIPIVVSSEVFWASPQCMTDPNDIEAIVKTMGNVLHNPPLVRQNKENLAREGERAKAAWIDFLTGRRRELTWTECCLGWCFKRFRRVE